MAIPPLNEQHRIVDKMDELTALCDALETRLQQSQVDGERLMESVVAHLATSVMEREVAA